MTIQEAIKKLWLLRNKYECLTYKEAEKISITNAEFVDAIQLALEALDEVEKLKEENVDLRFETVKAFERGQKFPCNLNCDNCIEKCRAWQNGHNATRERECGNCEVLKGMNAIAEVVSNTL